MGLTNHVAIVTGSSRGIGRTVVQGFAEEGAKATICARDEDSLVISAKEVEA